MAEIKCNIFGRVWLLKNFFFSECLYFSEYDIRMLFCYLGEWREMGGGGGREAVIRNVCGCIQEEVS